jgi:hypothetical protein
LQLVLFSQLLLVRLNVTDCFAALRELLGKEFKWRLVPVRLSPHIYEALQKIAPNGDVKRLIQETIQKLIKT